MSRRRTASATVLALAAVCCLACAAFLNFTSLPTPSAVATPGSTLAAGRLAATEQRGQRVVRAAAMDEVDKYIADNKIMVFSKSMCPFCRKAKKALEAVGAEFTALELDERDDTDAMQDALLEKTGGRSVPRVFIGGKFIGGGDDTVKMQKNGELEKLVQEVQR
eukprot:TRINITY_DN82266_c0_g1_i1.p1 TRINITY_DN82266_c0_g1~~TRINITY_DN82266_c0_g1_i1.p1  ORF type:complete len:164 (-),score=59.03 TRINITY_DN82266_c0_g1_i1:196-687(-)